MRVMDSQCVSVCIWGPVGAGLSGTQAFVSTLECCDVSAGRSAHIQRLELMQKGDRDISKRSHVKFCNFLHVIHTRAYWGSGVDIAVIRILCVQFRSIFSSCASQCVCVWPFVIACSA